MADERPADDARHREGAAHRRRGGLRGPPSRAVGGRLPGAGEECRKKVLNKHNFVLMSVILLKI